MLPKELRQFWRWYGGTLISIGMIVVAAAGTWWGLVPFIQKTVGVYQQAGKTRDSASLLRRKLALLASLDKEILRMSATELLTALPQEKAPSTVMGTIEGVANTSGLSVLALTITNPGSLATQAAVRQSQDEKKLGVAIIKGDAIIEGTVSQVGEFLRSIQKIRRILTVKGLETTLRDDGSARVHIALDAYYSPLPKELGGVDGAVPMLTGEQEDLMRAITNFPVAYQATTAVPQTFAARSDPFVAP